MALLDERTRRNLQEIERSGNIDQIARHKYGLPAKSLEVVAGIGARLAHPGAVLEAKDIKSLQEIYANQLPASEIASICSRLNEMPSGSRQSIFASILAGDTEGIKTGVPSTEEARQSLGFFESYSGFGLSSAVDEKLDASRPKDDFQVTRPKEDPYSTRAILERQIGPDRETALDMMSEPAQRQVLSHEFDKANTKLFGEGSEDLTLGQAVAAAWDSENIEVEARERGLISEE